MDFQFADEQLEIAEGARAFLEGECPPARLREVAEAPDATIDLWSQIVALGLLGALAPEEAGGLGLGPSEFVLIAENAGRVAFPEPLVETAGLIAPALSALGGARLSDFISGQSRIALAHQQNPFVNFADKADAILIMAPDRIALASVEEEMLSPRTSVDPLRRLFAIEHAATVGDALAEGDDALALYNSTKTRGMVFTSAELLGLASAMIAQATAYAKEREQFGAPIGAFQAVKHHLASAFTKVEFAKPIVYCAAAFLDDPLRPHALAACHAKRAAAEAAIFAAETAIQVHGAMGYTYEVDLHFWMKRAWALAGLWGGRADCDKVLEAALLAGGIPLGPGATFTSTNSSLENQHV